MVLLSGEVPLVSSWMHSLRSVVIADALTVVLLFCLVERNQDCSRRPGLPNVITLPCSSHTTY